MLIAIDGPAGAGKSAVAKLLAEKLKYSYLDTGAMYRGIALYFDTQKIDLEDDILIEKAINSLEISFKGDELYLNGENVEAKIRSSYISRIVSKFASVEKIRDFLAKEQRNIAIKSAPSILDGRDIASNVLPDADFKFYLDASSKIRAQRRFKDLNEKDRELITLEKLEDAILKRDLDDSTREHSPLIRVPEAIYINTDILTIEEVVFKIHKIITKK